MLDESNVSTDTGLLLSSWTLLFAIDDTRIFRHNLLSTMRASSDIMYGLCLCDAVHCLCAHGAGVTLYNVCAHGAGVTLYNVCVHTV